MSSDVHMMVLEGMRVGWVRYLCLKKTVCPIHTLVVSDRLSSQVTPDGGGLTTGLGGLWLSSTYAR